MTNERHEKALEAEDGHIWHERVFSSMKLKCCMNCGFVKNEDQPNQPCPGPVYVGLRNHFTNGE